MFAKAAQEELEILRPQNSGAAVTDAEEVALLNVAKQEEETSRRKASEEARRVAAENEAGEAKEKGDEEEKVVEATPGWNKQWTGEGQAYGTQQGLLSKAAEDGADGEKERGGDAEGSGGIKAESKDAGRLHR